MLLGDEIDISGFKISWSVVLVGIQSSLIVLPINLLIVFLFRQARPFIKNKTARQRKRLENAARMITMRRSEKLAERAANVACSSMGLDFVQKDGSSMYGDSFPTSLYSTLASETRDNSLDSSVLKIKDDVSTKDINICKYVYPFVHVLCAI